MNYIYIKKFCKHDIYCHYAISNCYSNKVSSVNMLHEHKLCGRSWVLGSVPEYFMWGALNGIASQPLMIIVLSLFCTQLSKPPLESWDSPVQRAHYYILCFEVWDFISNHHFTAYRVSSFITLKSTAIIISQTSMIPEMVVSFTINNLQCNVTSTRMQRSAELLVTYKEFMLQWYSFAEIKSLDSLLHVGKHLRHSWNEENIN